MKIQDSRLVIMYEGEDIPQNIYTNLICHVFWFDRSFPAESCCLSEVWCYLRGAEARIRLGAAGTVLSGNAGSHGAGDGVAGAGGALEGLLRDNLLQGVLLLYLEDVWLLSLVLTDTIVDEPIDSLLSQLSPDVVFVVVISPAEHHQALRLGVRNVGEVLQQLLSVGTDPQNILTLGETYGDLCGLAADVHQLRIPL